MAKTQLLVETPANLPMLFHDDPIVLKYWRKLGALVALRILSSKSDRELLKPRIEQAHRQLRGRQITLLKASKTATV